MIRDPFWLIAEIVPKLLRCNLLLLATSSIGTAPILTVEGFSERSRSKKALAMSFLLKGVPFCDGGFGVLLAIKGPPERSRSKKALAMSFFLKGVSFYDGGIVTYPALQDDG